MSYKPLKGKALVLPIKAEEVTKSGIIIPTQAQEKPNRGTVVAIGRDVDLAIGDVVIYGKYGGVEIKLDNETYMILREEDILLIEA